MPDENPNERLRLTAAASGEYPDADHEIVLYDLIGERITFECQGSDEAWVWGVLPETLKTAPSARNMPSASASGQSSQF